MRRLSSVCVNLESLSKIAFERPGNLAVSSQHSRKSTKTPPGATPGASEWSNTVM